MYYIALVYISSIHQIYIKQDLALAVQIDVYHLYTTMSLMYTMSIHHCLEAAMMNTQSIYTSRPSSSNDVYTKYASGSSSSTNVYKKYTSVLHGGQDVKTQLH